MKKADTAESPRPRKNPKKVFAALPWQDPGEKSPDERRRSRPADITPGFTILVANLKALMAAAKTTPQEVERKAGFPQKTVSRVVDFDNWPGLALIEKLAIIFDVTPGELLSKDMKLPLPLSRKAKELAEMYDEISDAGERNELYAQATVYRTSDRRKLEAALAKLEAKTPHPPGKEAPKQSASRSKPRTPARR